MNSIENNFYPAWVSQEIRDFVDLSELAEPNNLIFEEANILMRQLRKNIAIYKSFKFNKPRSIPNGLYSLYKAAQLKAEQLERLNETERKLKNYVIVAYTNLLEPHDKNVDFGK